MAIVPHAVAETHYTAAEVHDVRHTHCLMPGLVNAHTHVGMTLLRGFADDQLLMTWLSQHIWPAEFTYGDQRSFSSFVITLLFKRNPLELCRHCSPDFVKDGSDLAMAEMIRGGTTMFNDMYDCRHVTMSCGVLLELCLVQEDVY